MKIKDIIEKNLNDCKKDEKRPSHRSFEAWYTRFLEPFWKNNLSQLDYDQLWEKIDIFLDTPCEKEDFERAFGIKLSVEWDSPYFEVSGYSSRLTDAGVKRQVESIKGYVNFSEEELFTIIKMYHNSHEKFKTFRGFLTLIKCEHLDRSYQFIQDTKKSVA